MIDSLLLAQNLALAIKAMQMYTAAHPRAQDALAAVQGTLDDCLREQERIQFIVSGSKAFVNGVLQESKGPHLNTMVKLTSERGIGGFVFERGLDTEELMVFLQGFITKPARLEEEGGFEALLRASGVKHIKVSQTRYQEVTEGGESNPADKAPAFAPTPPPPPAPPSAEDQIKAFQAALLASIAKGGSPGGSTGSSVGGALGQAGGGMGNAQGGAPGGSTGSSAGGALGQAGGGPVGNAMGGSAGGSTGRSLGGLTGGPMGEITGTGSDTSTGGPADGSSGGYTDGTLVGSTGGDMDEGGLGVLMGFGPADLSGLGSLAEELGLDEDMPDAMQLETLREVIMSLSPEGQLSLLAGLHTLPADPAGLGLGVNALAGETLAMATNALLDQGASWTQLRGPVRDILRPLPDRQPVATTLSNYLNVAGKDASQIESILRHLEWEALTLEAKLLKVFDEDYLFELSPEQRLALLRELLDHRRFNEFLRIQERLTETLRGDEEELRYKSAQTLAGVSRWALDPGLPPDSEAPLAEALRAHFAWEPEKKVHRFTTDGLEFLVAALIHRGEFDQVIADFEELDGLLVFFETKDPWRPEALAHLRASILRTPLLDAALAQAFAMKRDQMVLQLQHYLEFLGDPMARHLVDRLGAEDDRTRRGRLVEVVRSMGPTALPALKDALTSPAWYLVRNALTLLSDLGDAGCLPDILPLLRHTDPRVKRAAVRALWKLGGPVAEPHLLAQMKDTDAETMQEILFALGQLRSEISLPQVAELAQDRRVLERLRVQALETLGLIASPRALPVLLECMRRKTFFASGEPQPIRSAAAKALAAIGTPEALEALRRGASAAPKGPEREALLQLLQRAGRP